MARRLVRPEHFQPVLHFPGSRFIDTKYKSKVLIIFNLPRSVPYPFRVYYQEWQ